MPNLGVPQLENMFIPLTYVLSASTSFRFGIDSSLVTIVVKLFLSVPVNLVKVDFESSVLSAFKTIAIHSE